MQVTKEEIDRLKELLEHYLMDGKVNDPTGELYQIDTNTKVALILKTLESDVQSSLRFAACDLIQKHIKNKSSWDFIKETKVIDGKRKYPFYNETKYQDTAKINNSCGSIVTDIKESDTEWCIAVRIFLNCLIRSKNERGREIAINLLQKNPRILENKLQFTFAAVLKSIVDVLLENCSANESLIPILFKEINSAVLNAEFENQTIVTSDAFKIVLELVQIPNECSNLSDLIESLLIIIINNVILFKNLMIPTTEKLLSIISYEKTSNILQTKSLECISIIFETIEEDYSLELSILEKIVNTFSQLIYKKYINHNWHTDMDKDSMIEDSFEKIIDWLNKGKNYLIVENIFESIFNSRYWNDQVVALIILKSMVTERAHRNRYNLSLYFTRVLGLINGYNSSIIFNCINTINICFKYYKHGREQNIYNYIPEEISKILNTCTNYGMLYVRCISLLNESLYLVTSKDILNTYIDGIFEHLDIYFKNYAGHRQDPISLSILKTSLKCTTKLAEYYRDDESYNLKNISISLLSCGKNYLLYTYADIYTDWLDCMVNIFKASYYNNKPIRLEFVDMFMSIDFRTLINRNGHNNALKPYLEVIDGMYSKYSCLFVASNISKIYSFIIETILKISKVYSNPRIWEWKDKMSFSDSDVIKTSSNILRYILMDNNFIFEYSDEIFNVALIIYCKPFAWQYCSWRSEFLINTIDRYNSKNQYEAQRRFGIVLKSFSETIYKTKLINATIICFDTLGRLLCNVSNDIFTDDVLTELATIFKITPEILININSGILNVRISVVERIHILLYHKLGAKYTEYFKTYITNIYNIYFMNQTKYNFKSRAIKFFEPFIKYNPDESHEIFEILKESIKSALNNPNFEMYENFEDFITIVIKVAPIHFHDVVLFIIDYFDNKIHHIVEKSYSDLLIKLMAHIFMILRFQPHMVAEFQSVIDKWLDFVTFCRYDYPGKLIPLIVNILQNEFEINYVLRGFQIHKALNDILRLIQYMDRETGNKKLVGEFFNRFELESLQSFNDWYGGRDRSDQTLIDKLMSLTQEEEFDDMSEDEED